MKKLILALGLALASSVALAQAEGPPPGGPGPKGGSKGMPMVRMQDDLGLSDEQVKKMREIRDAGGSREEMRAVLTPEQQAKAMELRKANKGERTERKAHMQKELGLSDEQMAKIEELRKADGSREEIRAVLTPEQQVKFDAMRSKREGKPAGKGPKPAAKPAGSAAEMSTAAPAAVSGEKPAE
jgi:Spy/CpxP family protein refolding chaperone